MEALVNAGGKGTRMGSCGIEKPMQTVGGKPTIHRVLDALTAADCVDRVLVSVSEHTLETERYVKGLGYDTVRTSGESFMDDIHAAFEVMDGRFVLTCPSDLPLLTSGAVDAFASFFRPEMQSAVAVVDEATVLGLGITPSYTMEHGGRRWVLSGVCVMDRPSTLAGDYLDEHVFETDWPELAVNVNTLRELELARSFFGRGPRR